MFIDLSGLKDVKINMRIKSGIICLTLALNLSTFSVKDMKSMTQGQFHELTTVESEHYKLKLYQDRLYNNSENLLLAKNSLINGEHEKVTLFLERILQGDRPTNLIKNRYLSLVHFLSSEYQKSLDLVSYVDPTHPTEYKEVCLLRLMNYTALKKVKEYKKEAPLCLSSIKESDDRALFWFRQFQLLTTDKEQIIGYNYLDTIRDLNVRPQNVSLWLKLALYLGKEKEITKIVSKLPAEAYEYGQNRELIALAYYRMGNSKMAQDFVSDLESANADNIKGNLNLDQGKPELAFGFYKLALQKKGNSLNAVKKALPLSWELHLWDQAHKLLDIVQLKHVDEKKKLAFKAAIYLRQKKFTHARKYLNVLRHQYQNITPLSYDLMESYLSLKEGDREQLARSSDRACKRLDGLNCYIQLQNLAVNNMSLGARTQDQFKDPELESFDIESLKKKRVITPLKESVIIDQKDIEELDYIDLHKY